MEAHGEYVVQGGFIRSLASWPHLWQVQLQQSTANREWNSDITKCRVEAVSC